MGFSDRLDKAISEALAPPQMLSAQSRVEQSKQDQRVKLIDQSADAAVHSIERILRALNEPDLKRIPSFKPLVAQLRAVAAGLGKDGVLRSNITSMISTPMKHVPPDSKIMPPDDTQLTQIK